jgi:hypothetical protein
MFLLNRNPNFMGIDMAWTEYDVPWPAAYFSFAAEPAVHIVPVRFPKRCY